MAATTGTTRTGQAAPTLIRTPVNQPGFAKELGQKVNWAIGKNLSTVEIRLTPDKAGTIHLRITQSGQNIQLAIRTADESTGQLMTQAVAGLRETLAQNGLQLNQVQVTHSGSQSSQNGQSQNGSGLFQNGQQAGQQNGSGQGQSQANNHGGNSQDTDAQPAPAEAARPAKRPGEHGGIDVFA
ncbi:MAG: flagellar hook-length control protein FliK [Limnobacter sp.]|nr:flagellar hook-length control protein FliK [Limnobacter sp.]